MTLLAKTSRAARAGSLGPFAAGLAPLLYCVLHASDGGQLDSPELLQASLSSPHQALQTPAALLAKLCTLLPLGSLSLRVSFASAIAFAIAARALYRSIDTLLRAQGVTHEALLQPVALGFTLFSFGAPLVLVHGTLAESHALSFACALLCLSRLTELEAQWPSLDLRPLYVAAVSFGLGVGVDLAAGLVVLPAALPTLSRVLHAKGQRPLLVALALAVFAATATHAVSLAFVSDPGRLTLAAQRHVGIFLTSPLHLLRVFWDKLSLFAVPVALGAIAALQTPGVRRLSTLWIVATFAPLLLHGLFAATHTHTPGLGPIAYVLPASAVLAAALAGALLAPDGRSRPEPSRGQLGAAFVLLALGALRIHEAASQKTTAQGRYFDALHERAFALLPARALLLLADPALVHALDTLEAEAWLRPDLRRVSLSRFDDEEGARALAHDAELRGLLRAYLLDGELSSAELETLSGKRPVFFDMDGRTKVALYDALRPQLLFYEVTGAGVTKSEERVASAAFRRDFAALRERLKAAPPSERDAAHLGELSWAAALYFAHAGDRDGARAQIAEGRELAPQFAGWDALSAVLGDEQARGPVDVQTLLETASP